MKRFVLAALSVMLFGGAANAGETGIINQAGPYESTMRFYLHPAHGFAGTPAAPQGPAAASENENDAKQTARRVASRSQRSDGLKTRYAADSQTNSK